MTSDAYVSNLEKSIAFKKKKRTICKGKQFIAGASKIVHLHSKLTKNYC